MKYIITGFTIWLILHLLWAYIEPIVDYPNQHCDGATGAPQKTEVS